MKRRSPAMRTSRTRRSLTSVEIQPFTAAGSALRAAISSAVRSPRRRSSSGMPLAGRATGVDSDDAELARADLREDLGEAGHVEDVLQHLAVRLEDHGERLVPARDGEEIGGALALLPEWRALSRPASWEEQRPRRVLAEACREERRRRRAKVRGTCAAAADGERRLDEIAHGVRIGEGPVDPGG